MLSCYCQTLTVQGSFFRCVYDTILQCPQQVIWTLKASDMGSIKREPSWRFMNCDTLPGIKATHQDYNHSGYDRGHMCPAADRSSSRKAMRATFVMHNIAPQTPKLNRGSWKRSEIYCRGAALTYDSIKILAMPIFLDRDTTFIGRRNLAVPHAFLKAAWVPANDSIIGLWFYFNHD